MKRTCHGQIAAFTAKRRRSDTRDELLERMREWCTRMSVTLSPKVKFGPGCAGHGLLATDDIDEGDELAIIPRLATLHHSPKLERAFKVNNKVKRHPWVSVILSIMAEWGDEHSKWGDYIRWLPDVGDLTIPHCWSGKYESAIALLGLAEHIDNDLSNIERDFELAMKLISKNKNLFPFTDDELKTLYHHCAFLMMSYSFTDPEEEDDSGEMTFELEVQKEEAARFMLPVGDLLNHTAEHNARIEFDDGALTVNAVKPIKKGEEIFNTFGDMANSRLLQMYGFAEPANQHDDVHIEKATIIEAIKEMSGEDKCEAADAKIKLLDSLGFFDEVRIDGTTREETFRATLAVATQGRSEFSAMVKKTRKAASDGGDIEQLEIELESNERDDLSRAERELFDAILRKTKEKLARFKCPTSESKSEQMINQFIGHVIAGSQKLVDELLN